MSAPVPSPGSELFFALSFRVLYNDRFARFSAALEKRLSEAEARPLLEQACLGVVRTHAMFRWLVDGVR